MLLQSVEIQIWLGLFEYWQLVIHCSPQYYHQIIPNLIFNTVMYILSNTSSKLISIPSFQHNTHQLLFLITNILSSIFVSLIARMSDFW